MSHFPVRYVSLPEGTSYGFMLNDLGGHELVLWPGMPGGSWWLGDSNESNVWPIQKGWLVEMTHMYLNVGFIYIYIVYIHICACVCTHFGWGCVTTISQICCSISPQFASAGHERRTSFVQLRVARSTESISTLVADMDLAFPGGPSWLEHGGERWSKQMGFGISTWTPITMICGCLW